MVNVVYVQPQKEKKKRVLSSLQYRTITTRGSPCQQSKPKGDEECYKREEWNKRAGNSFDGFYCSLSNDKY